MVTFEKTIATGFTSFLTYQSIENYVFFKNYNEIPLLFSKTDGCLGALQLY